MITWLIGLLAPTVGEKSARFVAYGLLGLLLVLAVLGGKCAYDASVVRDYRNQVNADAAIKDRKADQKAAERATIDENRRQFEADQLREAMDHAPKDPAISDDIERRVAFHKCLSLQQRARANGLEPPRCV